jgi:hypothetical protein
MYVQIYIKVPHSCDPGFGLVKVTQGNIIYSGEWWTMDDGRFHGHHMIKIYDRQRN